MEEAKTQENEKLQSALQDMQLQLKETKAMFEKEREAAKKAADIVPIVKEVPVLDNAAIEKISSENEKLKVRCFKMSNSYDTCYERGMKHSL